MTCAPFNGTVSIVIQKGNDGQTLYKLFDYEPESEYECLFGVHRKFSDMDSLNAALLEYEQDSIQTAIVKHTTEFESERNNEYGVSVLRNQPGWKTDCIEIGKDILNIIHEHRGFNEKAA